MRKRKETIRRRRSQVGEIFSLPPMKGGTLLAVLIVAAVVALKPVVTGKFRKATEGASVCDSLVVRDTVPPTVVPSGETK